MTIIHSNNFEAENTGSLPAGYAAIKGPWGVSAANPVGGAKSLAATGIATANNGDFLTYASASAQTAQKLTFAQKLNITPDLYNDNLICAAVRAGANGGSGYLMLVSPTALGWLKIIAYKINGVGGYAEISQSAPVSGFAAGDILITETLALDTTVESRIWKSGGTRPANPTHTINDGSYPSGHIGFYRSIYGGPVGQMAIDDLTYEDLTAGQTATEPGAPILGTPVAGDGSVSFPYTAPSSDGGSAITGYSLSVYYAADNSLVGTVPTTLNNPIVATGLPNGTSVYGKLRAINSVGPGPQSAASTPVAPTAAAPNGVSFPVTNASVYFSPYAWYSDGAGAMQANNVKGGSSFAWTAMRGGYMKFRATVGAAGTIALAINTATLSAIAAAGCPNIAWTINNGAIQSKLLATGDTSLALASGLAAGTYDVFVCFRGVWLLQDGDTAQNYVATNNKLHITSINLSVGGTLSAPTIRPKKMVVYGDSITEGDLSAGPNRNGSSQDASLTYGWLLAEALDAEVGIIGFYGKTWSWFDASWPNHAQGVSRLVGGLLTPAPDYVVINYGENDNNPGPAASTVTATLAAVSAAAPTAKIIDLIPFSGKSRTNLSAATLPSNGYRIDLAPPEMLAGSLVWSYDGLHPNQRGHANLAALLSNKVNVLGAVVPNLTQRTATINFNRGPSTSPVVAANMAGAMVSIYDEPTPDLYTVPRYQSGTETTDASGIMVATYGSTKPAGATAGYVIQFADGQHCNGQVVLS